MADLWADDGVLQFSQIQITRAPKKTPLLLRKSLLQHVQFGPLTSTVSVRASNFDCFCLSARTSEGVIAYYWSQFDIPIEDLEIVPEFSEERVLKALEDGIQAQRSVVDAEQIKITEITASCRYHHNAVGLCVCV